MRLDKCIADHSVHSRKEVKTLLRQGAVLVNGSVCKSADAQVNPDADEITLHGARLACQTKRYYMLNKPQGVISSTRDGRTPTVLSLLPPELRKGLFPAGRLDIDTEGMVLLTNDGDLAHRILSPKRHIPKYYLVKLTKPYEEGYENAFAKGLVLEDGMTCLPAKIAPLKPGENRAIVELCEGKFHQVKRMFAAVENHVEGLVRIQMGGLPINVKLGLGDYIALLYKDVEKLLKTPDFEVVRNFCLVDFCSYWINT